MTADQGVRTWSYGSSTPDDIIYTYVPTGFHLHSPVAYNDGPHVELELYTLQSSDPAYGDHNNDFSSFDTGLASPTLQPEHTSLDDLKSKLRQMHKGSKRRTVREGWSIGSALHDNAQVTRRSAKSAVPLRGYGDNEQRSKTSAFQEAERQAAMTGGQIAAADFNKTWWSKRRIIREGSVAYQRFIGEDSTYLRYHPIEEHEHACST
jgi:hypothetical protein